MTWHRRLARGVVLLTLAAPVAGVAGVDAGSFVERIAGAWKGKTVQSPAGELQYDIEFVPDGECAKGTADTGFSLHHWRFCDAGGDLTLHFLSDFRGNDIPLEFVPAVAEGDHLMFQSTSRDFLRVTVTLAAREADLRIFHGDNLHVYIRLERPGQCMAPATARAFRIERVRSAGRH